MMEKDDAMKQEGILVVVSGPSGVGKGTVCAKLLQAEKNLRISVSHTTREPRDGEIEGVNYFFKSRQEFERNIENSAYLEWAKVFDNYYGTPRDFVEDNIAQGLDILLEIDTQGASQVKKSYPEGVFIFLLPPSYEALKARLEGRKTETPEKIKKRLGEFRNEIRRSPMYDYLVVNDNVEDAAGAIEAIIRAEHLKFENSNIYSKLLGEE